MCGGCSAVCPAVAIQYRETVGGHYFPKVHEHLCVHCGRCLQICSGVGLIHDNPLPAQVDCFSGRSMATYVGQATYQPLLNNAQSGGVVSALLVNALESGVIKSAITVRMTENHPPRPEACIVREVQELYSTQKSKYSPVPLLAVLKNLKKADMPTAVVGLACHIEGLHNIQKLSQTLNIEIAFTIGLVCDRVLTYAAVDYLMAQANVLPENVLSFFFRDKSVSGYPGDVHMILNNKKSIVLPASKRMQIKDCFTPARCRICFDKMNIFSDITICDPHGIQGVDRKQGESALVVRTDTGKMIVESAKEKKAIEIRPVPYESILIGQGIEKKRVQWSGYIEAWKQKGYEVPVYYEWVQKYVIKPKRLKKYLRDIHYSLNLDSFSSRAELVIFIEKKLKKKLMIMQLQATYLFVGKIIKKGANLVKQSLGISIL